MVSLVPETYQEQFWTRHSNPRSGWSRVPTGPVLVYALYRRKWRLFVAGLVWAAINPLVFSPPENDEAWMTRAVLAERWWIHDERNRTVGVSYPNVCNLGSVVASVYTVYAAWRQRPAGTALGTALTVGLKFWWLRVLVRHYDDRTE